MAAVTPISQLACFSSINHRFYLRSRSSGCPIPRRKLFITVSLDRPGTDASNSNLKADLSYVAEESQPFIEEEAKSHLNGDGHVVGKPGSFEERLVSQGKRAAKIHDFCFGIPYGGLVLSKGAVGFAFSRDPTILLFGGALLALSTLSLKIWRQGKSSLPFILGQAGLAAVLFWKNFEAFSLTKKLFPTGFLAAISAAMVCFYSYVVVSGGNPPPKKMRLSTSEHS